MEALAQLERRLLTEQLQELVTWLEVRDDERPQLFGTCDEYEWMLRLAATVLVLLKQHRLDAWGRCRRCRQPRHGWRRWLPIWPQRTACRVEKAAAFFTHVEEEVVWWQAFCLRGDDVSLEQVRAWLYPDERPTEEWLASADHNDDHIRHALLTDGRVRLREEAAPADESGINRLSVRPYARAGLLTVQPTTPPASSAGVTTEELPKITKP